MSDNELNADAAEMNKDGEPDSGSEPGPRAPEEGADNGMGAVQISAGVIAMIARTTALNVPGVAGLCSTFMERLAGIFGRSQAGAGIKVEMEGRNVSIGLRIVAAHGVRIPEVVWQVQNDIRHGVEHITGKTVKTVNVIVQSVGAPSKHDLEESA